MPKIEYVQRAFGHTALQMLEHVDRVVTDYQAQGFNMTLRQVYYQMVAHDLFPNDRRWRWTGTKWVRDLDGTKNAEPNYKWLGDLVSDGRLAGLIDWESIEDRTRSLRTWQEWESPAAVLQEGAENYSIDRWDNQPCRIEVWVEKEALADIISRTCGRYGIPYFACKGYVSQSEMWAAAQRLYSHYENGQECHILHLGDHDPSGIDMTRDIEDRLKLFGAEVEVHRLALNMDQIRQFNPPPNPAKLGDSRSSDYTRRYGYESWELDALAPPELDRLVTRGVARLIDDDAWTEAIAREKGERGLIQEASRRWDDVVKFLRENP